MAAARRQVADRIDRRLEEIVDSMLAAFRSEIKAYSELDGEVLAEVRTTTRLSVALIIQAVAEGASLTSEAVPLLQELARRRAEQGVPVHALMRAYQIGTRVGWQFTLEELRRMRLDPRIATDVLASISLAILELAEQLTAAASEAYA